MTRPIRWYDYITVNIFFVALTFMSQTNAIVIPLLVTQFVGEESQGSSFGLFRLVTLMIALLSQSIFGMLSDSSTSRFGRRRPFIVISALLNLFFIAGIAYSTGMHGMSGYIFLTAIGILLQITSNIGQAAAQGLIPDVVPQEKRGRFSGVKALFELPLPMALAFLSGQFLIKKGMLREGLFVAMGVFLVCMLLTLLVPEKQKTERKSLRWAPFFRLVLMTAIFGGIIYLLMQVVAGLSGLVGRIESLPSNLVLMGFSGLAAMVIAVGLGVWISVRISIGEQSAKRNPSYTWWVVNRLAFLVGATNLSGFVVYFVQTRLGYTGASSAGPGSTLLLFVAAFIMISTIPAGWLGDRVGHKSVTIASGIVAAIGTVIAISVPSLAVIYVGGSIIGAATGLFFTSNWALGTEIVPKDQAGRYLGISNLAGAGAGAVGAAIGGPIADHFTRLFPETPGVGYVLLFGIYGVMFLLSILPLVLVREPKKTEEQLPEPA